MPDALSVGAQFVLYKPEGGQNYFFYDYHTGSRVSGADLARAKIIAEAQGITVTGNADKDGLYVRDADLNVWKRAHPDAPMRSMPEPAPATAPLGTTAKISQQDLVRQMQAEMEEFKSQGTFVGTMEDGTAVHLIKTPIPGSQDLPMYVPGIDQTMPAIEFEQKYGLKGIAGHYKYPPGMSARDVEDYAMMVWHKNLRGEITPVQMEEKLGSVRNMLEGLNPELKVLNAGASKTGTYDVILGATSGYNPKDIQSFLDGNYRDTFLANNPAWAKISNGLEEQGVGLGWVPSMETMQEIDRQVKARSIPRPVVPDIAPSSNIPSVPESTFGEGANSVFGAASTDNRLTTAWKNAKDLATGVDRIRGTRMPGGSPIFRSGTTLDEMVEATRTETVLTRIIQPFNAASSVLSESSLVNNPATKAVGSVLESNAVRIGGKVIGAAGTLVSVFEVSGGRRAVFGANAEENVFGEGIASRSNSYGQRALMNTSGLASVTPLGAPLSAASGLAYLGGFRSGSQLLLETVNSYNAKDEGDERKQQRWQAWTDSIPTTLFIGLTTISPDEAKANMAKNLTAFMKRYPDARQGDVLLLMRDENKQALQEMCREHPNWAYVDNFVRTTPVAQVRAAYAQYASENSSGIFTQAPLVGDQFQVPQQGALFYQTGDQPSAIPGAPRVDRDGLINSYTDKYHTIVSSPLNSSFIQQYTLTGQKQDILTQTALMQMPEAERKRYQAEQEENRRQDIAAGTEAARRHATTAVDNAATSLNGYYSILRTNIDQTTNNMFVAPLKKDHDLLRERLESNEREIAKADADLKQPLDDESREATLKYQRGLIQNNAEMNDWYMKCVEKRTGQLTAYIQERVANYTKFRDTVLFGGTYGPDTTTPGQTTPGLQAALNDAPYVQGPKVSGVDVKSFLSDTDALKVDTDRLLQIIENSPQAPTSKPNTGSVRPN